jgi:hypothetical protein
MATEVGERPREERTEDEQERLNRQLMELLQELRVAIPGVQVRAFHRMTFQQREKPNIIHIGTGQMLLGLAALAVAINGAVLLVTDWLFQASTAAITVAVLASVYFTLWFGLGLVRRAQK